MSRIDRERPSAPEPLNASHDFSDFCSGVEVLDKWLATRARFNQKENGSRTYVACVGTSVIGYYSLANGSLNHASSPGNIRRNMPDPIPMMLLGQLAVHEDWQGQGIGSDLLQDACLRTIRIAEQTGTRALMVHALSEQAVAFYLHHGFIQSPTDPALLMVLTSKLMASLG